MAEMLSPEQQNDLGQRIDTIQPQVGKISVFEALASETPHLTPNRSNYSSRQGNADYDDQ